MRYPTHRPASGSGPRSGRTGRGTSARAAGADASAPHARRRAPSGHRVNIVPGAKLGPFEVVDLLGAGGMGEVWRARDPRLGRDVAIKALPDAFARDPERLARFEREARLLASLSHQNIAGIHGLEEVAGHRYLVLEYVEGPTLAERLAHGPLAFDEALEVCRQIAAGVEAAHESGVVHRDLKPGNVKLTPGGQVKVLDFGLAKGGAASGTGSDPNLSASPTRAYTPTAAGVILGTAAYMSPEQARGRAVDRRTDIWSFGCVLYECLAGRPMFEGETVSDLIARILEREPDWSALPATTPPRVRELLRRCLRKDAKERLRDIGDARVELGEILAGGGAPQPAAAASTAARRWALPGAVLALGLALAAFAAWRGLGRPAGDPHLHMSVTHEAGGTIAPFPAAVAISPDGRRIAYVVADSSADELWVRDLDAPAARRVGDATAVSDVFWSPDSRYLGFATTGDDARLWKVPAEGGSPVSLCDVTWSRGATWGKGGDIVFSPAPNGPLYRVSAGGGEARLATALDTSRHETAHRMPWFLPDGDHFLYASLPRTSRGWDIFVGSLRSKAVKRVLTAGSGVTYAAPGYLLYVRDDKLVAHRFDPARLALRGDPLPIADPPPQGDVDASWRATAARDGRLAMLHRRDPDTRVEWLSRGGEPGGTFPLPSGRYTTLDISPDGTSALAERTLSALRVEIWHSDPARGTTSRVSPTDTYAYGAYWLPDGRSFVYSIGTDDGERVCLGQIGDAGAPRRIATNMAQFQHPSSVTPDGSAVLFSSIDPATRFDIWSAPLAGGAAARLLVRTPGWDDQGVVSPDGRWLAYSTDASGQTPEVYIQAYPGPGPATRVSTSGGVSPHWTHGGRELLFQRPDPGGGSLLSVTVDGGPALHVGKPQVLFHRTGLVTFAAGAGERILASTESGAPPPATIALILDWTAQLQGR